MKLLNHLALQQYVLAYLLLIRSLKNQLYNDFDCMIPVATIRNKLGINLSIGRPWNDQLNYVFFCLVLQFLLLNIHMIRLLHYLACSCLLLLKVYNLLPIFQLSLHYIQLFHHQTFQYKFFKFWTIQCRLRSLSNQMKFCTSCKYCCMNVKGYFLVNYPKFGSGFAECLVINCLTIIYIFFCI